MVTCFWPDHLELHGSLERYRAAKEAIVRGQGPTDIVVANADDEDAAAIASLSPGLQFAFSMTSEVDAGAFRRGDMVLLRDATGERSFRLPQSLDAPRLQALLAAAATAVAVGALPEALGVPEAPPYRATRVGHLGETELIDDGMATTPTKAASALHEYADGSVVLVAGGELESAGLAVHASREEQALLEQACAEARRVASLVVLFGPHRRGWRGSSTGAERFARRPSTRRSPSPRPTPRVRACSSSPPCSRSRPPIANASAQRSRRSRPPGILVDTLPLLAVTIILHTTVVLCVTREEET